MSADPIISSPVKPGLQSVLLAVVIMHVWIMRFIIVVMMMKE